MILEQINEETTVLTILLIDDPDHRSLLRDQLEDTPEVALSLADWTGARSVNDLSLLRIWPRVLLPFFLTAGHAFIPLLYLNLRQPPPWCPEVYHGSSC
jgi:hypothetical protein